MSRKKYPEHPCVICETPTQNKEACSRVCSGKLVRTKSSGSNPGPRPHRRIPVETRFWSFVGKPDDPNECWDWFGNYDRNHGYPTIHVPSEVTKSKKQTVNACRISWELYTGRKIPKGYIVIRECRTPKCCNPRHLICGKRGKVLGEHNRLERRNGTQGEANSKAKLTDAECEQLRTLREEGDWASIKALAEEKGMYYPYLKTVARSPRGLKTRYPRKGALYQ